MENLTSRSEYASSTNSDIPQIAWHILTADQALERLEADFDRGLSQHQVARRRARYGSNELIERGLKSPWRILFEQFTDAMVMVLLAAAVISIFVKDPRDAIVIGAIVVLNAILGFVQEYRAERAMAALKQMAAPRVKVRRDGDLRQIDASELVPGDIIQLEAGDSVPADARLLEANSLRAQEASLTGESVPVDKHTSALPEASMPVGDRANMVFMGTAITYGRGTALVAETGMRTELGRIAELIQSVESEPTPLQRRMARLGKTLAVAALVIVALVFGLGVIQGGDLADMFFTAVALAVAAVPEGLPAVVTISLALGAQRMLRRQALIRKLPAVETLGSVTAICSDKTGTLTENRMTVKILDVAEHTLDLDEILRDGMPVLRAADERSSPSWTAQTVLLTGGALCNDAELQEDPESEGNFGTIGDPTEGALLVAAARNDLWRDRLEMSLPRVAEIPFSSERKRMTTLHRLDFDGSRDAFEVQIREALQEADTQYVSFTKGAVDNLLELSSHVWVEGALRPLDEHWRERIRTSNDRLAKDGLRVLGVAYKPWGHMPEPQSEELLEQNLVFVGMIGMIDPPRPEVKESVRVAKTAGIRPIMITGDHPLTAQRIAKDLGITDRESFITGSDLEKLDEGELSDRLEDVSVFARVAPEHKLRIVEVLQNKGHIVAMTGDGVNDAPALRRSDIGVAMGITGTDVSKEAADMVILDDNFATIVRAVREGRTIYENIRKFIKYTLTSNAGEILVMLLAPLIGMPLPLSAIQILWINLVTDGLPGLALSQEVPEADIMERPPKPTRESILARGLGFQILWIGLLMALVSLGIGYWGWNRNVPYWRTMVFTTLTLSQMGNALAIRSDRQSLFRLGLLTNKAMLGAVLLTLILQLLATYWQPMQALLSTRRLPLPELLITLLASTIVFWAIEIVKWRMRSTRSASSEDGKSDSVH
jgi:Ca2+-transporting ATPase